MPEVEHKDTTGFSFSAQQWTEAKSPFDPPSFASAKAKIAYEKLRVICSDSDPKNPKIIDNREIISTIRETYYNTMDFVEIKNDIQLCLSLDKIYWWKLNGQNIYWLSGLSIFGVIFAVFLQLLWKKRLSALAAVDRTIISGLASSVRLKRKTLKNFDELKRRVRDEADRDQNSK